MTQLDFAMTAKFDRDMFWDKGNSVRYLVVRLCARDGKKRPQEERAPLNVALAIDASGSMAGGELEAAKKAALGLVKHLSEKDCLTVVSFASDIQVHLDAAHMTASNKKLVQDKISALETRGMTCLSGGWFAGIECAARVFEADASLNPRVILLSDGHANQGIVNPDELCEHAGELRARGVLTSCLGIGDGYDEQLLMGMAKNGGGRLHDAELAGEISSVLLGELDEIFNTVIDDAQISLSASNGVKVEVLGKHHSRAGNGRKLAFLGPVQNEVERVAVFKVTCPAARANDELEFKVSASGRAKDGGAKLESVETTCKLTAADSVRNSAQPRDEEIAEIVARFWRDHIVAETARMNRDGDLDETRKFIATELKYFRRYVEKLRGGREMIEELELMERNSRRRFSTRLRKEMILQSALSMEDRADHRGFKPTWRMRMIRGQ